jgi:hypothetical protein
MSTDRHRLAKHIPIATNMHAIIEEPVSKQRIGKHNNMGIVGNGVFSLCKVVTKKSSVENSQSSSSS